MSPILRAAEILGLSVSKLARRCDVSQPAMHKYAHGEMPVPPQVAIKLEQMTTAAGKTVPRSDFRADWISIWPEFIPPARPLKKRRAAVMQ